MCRVTSSPKADSERSRVYCCSSCPSSVIVSLFIRTRRKRNPTKMLGRHSILGESFEDIGAMAGRKSDFGNGAEAVSHGVAKEGSPRREPWDNTPSAKAP